MHQGGVADLSCHCTGVSAFIVERLNTLRRKGVMVSRSTILMLLVVMPAASVLSAVYFMSALKRFMGETPSIDTAADLETFKSLVRKQMYAALVQIALLGLPILLFLMGMLTRTLWRGDFLYVLIPNLVVIVVGRVLRAVERKAQMLPVSDPQLEKARDEIVHTWEKKALPDWS
jgi:hypothetical protein